MNTSALFVPAHPRSHEPKGLLPICRELQSCPFRFIFFVRGKLSFGWKEAEKKPTILGTLHPCQSWKRTWGSWKTAILLKRPLLPSPLPRWKKSGFEIEIALEAGAPVVPVYAFLGEGSPTKIDYRKTSWYPYSSLSTGRPRQVGTSVASLPAKTTRRGAFGFVLATFARAASRTAGATRPS